MTSETESKQEQYQKQAPTKNTSPYLNFRIYTTVKKDAKGRMFQEGNAWLWTPKEVKSEKSEEGEK